MKKQISIGFASALMAGFASADGLYYVGSEAQESLPLKWVVGADLTWDDNVTPGAGRKEDSLSINPYVGLSFVNITPQTTWDVYARLGVIYYFDQPDAAGADDTYGQARVGANVTHRFNERLRLSSRNFVAYELEPNYDYGVATTRQLEEYFYWQTDNALGYRWSERLATYTGFQLSGLEYDDVPNMDRFIWTIYNQFRYQLSPQTVLTLDYRYSETEGDGRASDSTNQYLLAGVEHRFSPTTILIARGGAQFRDVDNGGNSTSPFVEISANSQVNSQFRVRGFVRYGLEDYDTVNWVNGGQYEFSERKTLRLGVSGSYALSPSLSLFGGADYIPTTFDDGRLVGGVGPNREDGVDEDILNLYVGLTVRFTDYLTGSLTYNFTDSDSDIAGRDYDRSRVSVGVRAEF